MKIMVFVFLYSLTIFNAYSCEVDKSNEFNFIYSIDKTSFKYKITSKLNNNITYIVKNYKELDNTIGFYVNNKNYLYSSDIFIGKKITNDLDNPS